jgi:hypothetical protein
VGTTHTTIVMNRKFLGAGELMQFRKNDKKRLHYDSENL